MLYLDVVNLIEDLHHLTIMAPMVNKAKDGQNQLVSQIADGKHSSLRSLSVYADVLSISSSPHLIFAPFTHLEYLALHYVYFTESSLDSVPIEILPRLQHFEFTGGECVWVLDEWLQACPNLEHLTLQNTNLADAPSQPPLQLMTMDKLKRLDLLYMPKYSQSGPYSFAWLQECGSISHLAIDYDILTSFYDEGGHLHLGDLLTLQLPFDYEGDFDTTMSLPFERDSKGNDTVSPTASSDIPCKIKFQAECRHQPWYCANEQKFQEYEGGRFNFSFQNPFERILEDGSGLYRGLMQFAVYIGVVKGWPVLKRLMDRETREMSLWQYPTLKALVEP
ncbi:hypothetical protein FRC17_001047 [Serendipita sp. 399]|nr:hypothetical protein FRC17_001047 [Serendipita sp. 399]